jgi:hypothetical protein
MMFMIHESCSDLVKEMGESRLSKVSKHIEILTNEPQSPQRAQSFILFFAVKIPIFPFFVQIREICVQNPALFIKFIFQKLSTT